MRIVELIEILRQYDDDIEVRLAQQPSWPFEYSIGRVDFADAPEVMTYAEAEALDEDAQERADERAERGLLEYVQEGENRPLPILYIGEGRQLGYLPERAVAALEWGRN